MTFITKIQTTIREFILFVLLPLVFVRRGKCNQCGSCCRHVYLRDGGKFVATFDQYLHLIKTDAMFKQFNVKGRDPEGYLYFGCDGVRRDNVCAMYEKRPALCREYPDIGMLHFGAVPKPQCGFYFVNRFTGKKVEE